MSKESTKKALEAYYRKLLPAPENQSAKRTNKAPEKIIQKEIHLWLKAQGFYAFRVEAKAVYSHELGRYNQGQTIAGCPDELAVSCTGQFLAVEVKAPGKRSTLREAQREFLFEVISRNGFAACSDSVSHLSYLWSRYNSCDPALKKALLLADIPKERVCNDPLF